MGIRDKIKLGLDGGISVGSVGVSGNDFSLSSFSKAFWMDSFQPSYKDAAKTQLVTALNDLIYTGPDWSGNNHDAVMATAGVRPTYTPDGVNGHPGFVFTGDKRLVASGVLSSAFNSAITIYAVIQGRPSVPNTSKAYFGSDAFSLIGWDEPLQNRFQGGGTLAWQPSAEGGVSPSIRTLSYDGVNKTYRKNGLQFSYASTPLSLGGDSGNLTVGDYAGTGFSWPGPIGELIVVLGAHSQAMHRQVEGLLRAKWQNGLRMVVFDGDSLTSGYLAYAFSAPVFADLTLIHLGSGYTGANAAVSGQAMGNGTEVGTMSYDAATQIDPVAADYSNSILHVLATNDVWDGIKNWTAEQCYNNIANYFAARTGFGKKAVGTIPPRTNANPDFETKRLAVNALIMAGYSTFADLPVDYAGDARLQNPADGTNYNADQTHWTAAGHAVAADILETALDTIGI